MKRYHQYHQAAPWIEACEKPPEQATGAIDVVHADSFPGGPLVEN